VVPSLASETLPFPIFWHSAAVQTKSRQLF